MEAGVDEAGRGPVIGPLVIAIVMWSNDEAKSIGVKDSKKLTRASRERLFNVIMSKAPCVKYIHADPQLIDKYALRGLLNVLEAELISRLIGMCPGATRVYVDSPDPNPIRFRALINSGNVEVIAENHADESIPLVSAASIVAKVVRDREIDRLKAIYGDFGSGYPSDPRTIRFLKERIEKGELPPIVRRSWATVKRLLNSRLA